MAKIEYDANGMPIYAPDGVVLEDYLTDRRHVSVVRGPIGSGTSSCSCIKIYMLAMEQRLGVDGIRRSRWGIVRNTYPELKATTIRTWTDWFKEHLYGPILWEKPARHVIRLGDMELEVFFIALDVAEDVRKMRSLEVTGWWFNEMEFIPKEIFDEAETRTGRFPAEKDGGSAWDGVIADMNAPPEDHWLVQMTGEAPLPDDMPEEEKALMVWPADWGYHVQPPALLEVLAADGKTVVDYELNPKAENVRFLKPGYYDEKRKGKSKRFIDARLRNKITFLIDGSPVWPNFDEDVHLTRAPMPFQPGREVIVSLDFGRRPTALISQEIGSKIQVQREFRMYGASASVFAPALKRFLEKNYRGATIRFTGDPKGQDRGQAEERTAYEIFDGYGMRITPAPVRNNNLEDRLESVSYALLTNRIMVSWECTTLRAAMAGRYQIKKIDIGDAPPVKDKYSDVADCLQYLCLFLGEGRRMMGITAAAAAKAVKVVKRTLGMSRVPA